MALKASSAAHLSPAQRHKSLNDILMNDNSKRLIDMTRDINFMRFMNITKSFFIYDILPILLIHLHSHKLEIVYFVN